MAHDTRDLAANNGDADLVAMAFTPAVDITECEQTTAILAETPGVAIGDINVTLECQVLSLSAQGLSRAVAGVQGG